MTVEVLYFDGCPSHEALLPRLRRPLAEAGVAVEIQLRHIESADAAERERFLGSPTVRIGGRDVEPAAVQRTDYGLKCRLYPTDEGLRGTPPDVWILNALATRVEWPRLTPRAIGLEQLRGMVDGGAQLVEVLPAAEYEEEHLPGALSLPLKELDGASAERLDRSRAVIVYCYDSL